VLLVIEYVTGTNRAPAGGWQNLRDKGGNKSPFSICECTHAQSLSSVASGCQWGCLAHMCLSMTDNLDDVDNQMPRAHTCFNKMDLPNYSNRAKLAEQLFKAITMGMGFGDA
jgi:hypothetical protein